MKAVLLLLLVAGCLMYLLVLSQWYVHGHGIIFPGVHIETPMASIHTSMQCTK
ncbi:hypothetical protein [Deminuibacter soli]|uniref:hypothetical protein n=1 Tax=Deminuibacter soli TaxID=2291815 RepID=UPI001314218E|nr:hypothetical protein [Deminuibacter soli]